MIHLIKNSNWIEKSIQIIKENDKIKSTSPVEERSRQKAKKLDENSKVNTNLFRSMLFNTYKLFLKIKSITKVIRIRRYIRIMVENYLKKGYVLIISIINIIGLF